LAGKIFGGTDLLKKIGGRRRNYPQLLISEVLLARHIVIEKIHSAMNTRVARERKFFL